MSSRLGKKHFQFEVDFDLAAKKEEKIEQKNQRSFEDCPGCPEDQVRVVVASP